MVRHLIIAAHDGVLTRYTGVGTIVQNAIRCLNAMHNELPGGTRVHLACPQLEGGHSLEDEECLQRSLELVSKTGGELIEIDNGTSRASKTALWGYGQTQFWKAMSRSLAERLANLTASEPGPTVVMAHDTPFLHLQLEPWSGLCGNRTFFYLPHSTGANHGQFAADGPDAERLAFEHECLTAIDRDPHSFLCATGQWIGEHLEEVYGVRPDASAYLPNGLHFPSYQAALSRRVTIADIRKFVPTLTDDTRIIFAWGRASRVKGFVPLIEGWSKIASQHPNHILVLQAPDESGEPEYAAEIAERARFSDRCLILDDFDPSIWQTFLQSPLTDVVAIPSLADPNPHTPLEARLFSSGSYAIVGSRIDGIV